MWSFRVVEVRADLSPTSSEILIKGGTNEATRSEEVRHPQLSVYKNHRNGYNIYVLFIVLLIGFIFNFFYCYNIILEKKNKKLYCNLLGLRGKKTPLKKQKWLKNVGGKADSLPAPLFILNMFFFLCVCVLFCDQNVTTERWQDTLKTDDQSVGHWYEETQRHVHLDHRRPPIIYFIASFQIFKSFCQVFLWFVSADKTYCLVLPSFFDLLIFAVFLWSWKLLSVKASTVEYCFIQRSEVKRLSDVQHRKVTLTFFFADVEMHISTIEMFL